MFPLHAVVWTGLTFGSVYKLMLEKHMDILMVFFFKFTFLYPNTFSPTLSFLSAVIYIQ